MSEEIAPERIAETLRSRIRSGELPRNSRLPTQRALSEEFGVNRGIVRQVLAVLEREGFVSARGRGAPAVVSAPASDTPRPAGVEVADRIALAFQAERVSIDAFTLTTETLSSALAGPLIAISAGELKPRSITVRVLLPSWDAPLAFPRLITDPADPRPMARLRELTRTFSTSLRHQLNSLAEMHLVPEVSVEIRTVAVTPLQKLYLLNGTEALTAYYTVVPRTVEYEKEQLEIYDVLGLSSKIFRSSSDKDSRDEQEAAYVTESRLWFESLWSTISRPLTLG
ncbi:winged helix-turn-helix domain-containing protein [Streptomyces carpaticus]|uniref:Regulatory protein, gntR family n=2 Tax=Streptomyces TaxID=1883 RepID=A0A1I6P5F2_9ACTN|nr:MULTISPECIES: winged helix-turn-helix domain-containing protein [Streptomyces]MCK1817310.1 winged helix-turn-helix domain-containing protein [Streptomyces sp. XM4011]QKV70089.1 winged helix-turn-helix transcriptional regulator [Streptomyces harbinensis]UWM50470.1 winged helix-turn-helix domain-containing protein [Streptomyces carpaticus]SFS35361.1 regulatory protein, gntR family [Streptomyces harbinensis]